jgi:hypothetical protein
MWLWRVLVQPWQSVVWLRFETAQGDSGATPNPTTNLRHQMTALLKAERSVPAGMT